MTYDLRKYIAPDGLMNLEPLGFREPYGYSQLPTCDNDNGILNRAFYLWLAGERPADFASSLWALAMTESKTPGLYHRNRGRVGRGKPNDINSKDNMIAGASICIWHDYNEPFKNVIKHCPVLNDQSDKKFPFNIQLHSLNFPSGIHQPSDWIIYYLAAGERPGWLTTSWLAANLYHQIYYVKASDRNEIKILAWLKLNAMEHRMDLFSKPQRAIVRGAIDQYKDYIESVGGIQRHFSYFMPHHPIYQESRGLIWSKQS